MKIIMVAPVHREKEFLHQAGNEPFLYGQGQQSWYEALKSLGQTVEVFRYSDSFIIPNTFRIPISDFITSYFPVWKGRFNRYAEKFNLFWADNLLKSKQFEKIANQLKPDIILVSGGLRGVSTEVLEEVKKKNNAKAILLSGVNPEYGSSKLDRILVRHGFFDSIFVNDSGYAKNWRKMGAKKVVVLPLSSADLKVHKKMSLTKKELKEYASDVCFIGTLSQDRQEVLEALTSFNLKIWGDMPPATHLSDTLKPFFKGKAYGEKMVKIYNAAKIVLNIHAGDMKFGGNMKTFEIPATGAFQLIDTFDSSWFVEGKEVVQYTSVKDLTRKIEYYLGNEQERKKIATAGYKKVLAKHTYKEHFKRMIEILSE